MQHSAFELNPQRYNQSFCSLTCPVNMTQNNRANGPGET